jgi:hypothetical protein
LETNAAINAGGKVNPVPIGTNGVFPVSGMNAGYGAGFNTVGHAFAGFRNNGVGHISPESEF